MTPVGSRNGFDCETTNRISVTINIQLTTTNSAHIITISFVYCPFLIILFQSLQIKDGNTPEIVAVYERSLQALQVTVSQLLQPLKPMISLKD